MQALITGGVAFIGSRFIELLLQRGRQVLVWDNFSTGRQQYVVHLEPIDRLVIKEINAGMRSQILDQEQELEQAWHLFRDH